MRTKHFYFVEIILFFILALAFSYWTWNNDLAGGGGDNTYYLFMAEYFSPWSKASDTVSYFASQNPYPPLYPFLLGVFGGGESILAAHQITTVCFLLALAVLYFWLKSIGISRSLSILSVTCFALLPGTIKHTMFIWSENLYLLLTLLTLFLVNRFEAKGKNYYLMLAALASACAFLTRSAGISLTLTFILYLLIKQYPLRIKASAAIVAAAPIIWYPVRSLFYHSSGSASYLSSLTSHYWPNPLSKMLAQLQNESKAVMVGWLSNFQFDHLNFISVILAIVCLAGLCKRLYEKKLDGLYVIGYLAVIIFWPYPAEATRFLFVIIPVLIAQALLMLDLVPSLKLARHRLNPAGLVLLTCIIASLPGLLLTAERFQSIPKELMHFRRSKLWYTQDPRLAIQSVVFADSLLKDIKSLGGLLPPDAVLYSIKPSLVGFYSKKKCYSFPEINPATGSGSQKRRRELEGHYFYMLNLTSPSTPEPLYPFKHLQHALDIVHVSRIGNSDELPIVSILGKYKVGK